MKTDMNGTCRVRHAVDTNCSLARGCLPCTDLPLGSGFALESINLRVEPGQLVGVVGSVGSSKSSLLMAVLREISPEKLVGVPTGGHEMNAEVRLRAIRSVRSCGVRG